ncbi:MAG: sterol desaturase family protein [Pseudomonadota bacterium]
MSERIRHRFEDIELAYGKGQVAGFIAVSLGMLGTLGALCFLFPEIFTTPEFRQVYNVPLLRSLLHGVIATSFVAAVVSIFRGSRWLGLAGMALATLAALLGSMETAGGPVDQRSAYAGLDYFVLTLFILALVFIPLERLFPKNPEQKMLRKGWTTDLNYFLIGHVGIQLFTFFTIVPAQHFFAWAIHADFQKAIAAQPVWLQFIEILVVIDFFSYWIHRAMHEVPALWKIHAVHHSSEHMDWLASSRLHFLEIIANRLIGYLPIFILGFSAPAVYAYLVFISFHAIFIHANVRFRFPYFRWVLATPEFHHWHHSSQPEAIDRNYAAFLPVYDRLFGTVYLPSHLATRYSTVAEPPPEGFRGQFMYPFREWLKRGPARD